ncbi:lantibiotic dehydratase C-terminal domain-containing protein [Streptomyces sp. SBR177]
MSSTETERRTEEWAPLHVFLPMSLQPRFLRDVIRPLMDEAGLRNRFWYLRYWQGGPHIRLRLHEAPPGTVEAVRDALAAAVPPSTRPRRSSTSNRPPTSRAWPNSKAPDPWR